MTYGGAAGAGLAFIIYPEVVSRLPISPLWAIMFFMMLITLGMGTQFSVVCTVHTTLLDVFPAALRRGRRPTALMTLLCFIGFLMGLICCTRVRHCVCAARGYVTVFVLHAGTSLCLCCTRLRHSASR